MMIDDVYKSLLIMIYNFADFCTIVRKIKIKHKGLDEKCIKKSDILILMRRKSFPEFKDYKLKAYQKRKGKNYYLLNDVEEMFRMQVKNPHLIDDHKKLGWNDIEYTDEAKTLYRMLKMVKQKGEWQYRLKDMKNKDGKAKYIPDYFYPKSKLVVEVYEPYHDTYKEETYGKDRKTILNLSV